MSQFPSQKQKSKVRLDKLLVEKGFAKSRDRAQALILAGKVLVGKDSLKIEKPGTEVPLESLIRLKGEDFPYVGRGGVKLEGALDDFKINTENCVALDVGSSTGGFTDCLLKRGAAKIYAIDVGTNQLDWSLRQHPSIHSMENTNFRDLPYEAIGEKCDLITIDASFISLTKLLPNCARFLKPDGKILALIKPQFEVKKEEVGKKGVVKNETLHTRVIHEISNFSKSLGYISLGVKPSQLKGPEGNQEYFIFLQKTES